MTDLDEAVKRLRAVRVWNPSIRDDVYAVLDALAEAQEQVTRGVQMLVQEGTRAEAAEAERDEES